MTEMIPNENFFTYGQTNSLFYLQISVWVHLKNSTYTQFTPSATTIIIIDEKINWRTFL